ncbi:MAG: hypothetical protein HQL37_06045 [Alphaproteobacteria bacterium]|nr:hypothetical protein [Alphaproteobacteria bacterium]
MRIASVPPLKLREIDAEVLHCSNRGRWSQIGDFGGITLPLDEALAYVAENGIFWTWV